MDSNGVININGNSFNATGNINVYGNANVTLTASPGIYFNNLKSENLVYYLVLDENNALKYTTLSPEENPILNLNTNLIQSEPNCNLTVGYEIDQININGETIQFSNKLNCNTISFNQPVEINTEMRFLNTVNVNKDINVKGGDVILENKNTNLITINCNQFTTPIPINTFGGLIIGKSNFSSTITINNIIGNTTLGSKKISN